MIIKKTISGCTSLNNSRLQKEFEIKYPSVCPICNKSGTPSYLDSYFIDSDISYPNLFVHFFCPNCEKTFLGNYHIGPYYDKTDLMGFKPIYRVEERKFSKHIKALSPDFCSIYNQAYASQQYRLNDISGMAYRKALEFLVKDYAIFLRPDDKEAIIKAPLSQCINNYIDNGKIKHLAVASAWIGNDETHYERKQQEYNVDDLIEFINAIVSFIDFDISAMNAEKMTKKN